jgi:hypothetical protein
MSCLTKSVAPHPLDHRQIAFGDPSRDVDHPVQRGQHLAADEEHQETDRQRQEHQQRERDALRKREHGIHLGALARHHFMRVADHRGPVLSKTSLDFGKDRRHLDGDARLMAAQIPQQQAVSGQVAGNRVESGAADHGDDACAFFVQDLLGAIHVGQRLVEIGTVQEEVLLVPPRLLHLERVARGGLHHVQLVPDTVDQEQ